MILHRALHSVALLGIVASLAACSAGDAASGSGPRKRARESSSGAIETPTEKYREIAVTNGGSVTGRVTFDGTLPVDSVSPSAADARSCGSATSSDVIPHTDSTIGNAVVWISDVRSGRALPVERRLEVVHEECVLAPRVQAVVIGSTVNVRNQDPLVYRMRAVRDGSNDTLAVFRFADAGQVVPNEKIAAVPGLVGLQSDELDLARAWIAVFDHPYFAVTGADGSFQLDSVPPGRYHVRVWHERGRAVAEREVEVKAGGAASVSLNLQVR